MVDNDTGQRLRAIRQRNRLSQRELARRSGVANASISLIESGKLNPTVSMLKKVLDGVPVSLGEFFSDEEEVHGKVIFRASELTEIADGGVSYRQVGANLGDKAIQFLHECYEPGATTGKHQLRHEGEECGLVLSGRLDLTVDGITETLRAGDAYYFESHRPHRFANTGRSVCEVITACTPPTF